MYLVQLACLMDDFPLRLFAERREAEEFIVKADFDECLAFAERKIRVHVSEAIGLMLITFGGDGVPVSAEWMRDADDDRAAPGREPERGSE